MLRTKITMVAGLLTLLLPTFTFANDSTSWTVKSVHDVFRITNNTDHAQTLTVRVAKFFLIDFDMMVHANAINLNCGGVMSAVGPGREGVCVLPANSQAELTLIMNTKYPSTNWGSRGTYRFTT